MHLQGDETTGMVGCYQEDARMKEVLLYEIKHGIVMDIIVSRTAGRQAEW